MTLGSARPATVPDVRLHEVILRLKDLTGESVYETITADCFGFVLALAILAVPAASQALDMFLPIRLPWFVPRIPSVPLNETVIAFP